MTGPRFDNSISWNLILAVVLAVTAGGVSYGAALSRIEASERRLEQERLASAERVEALRAEIARAASEAALRIAEVKADGAQREGRLRIVENTLTRQDEKLITILETVQKIEARLEGRPGP